MGLLRGRRDDEDVRRFRMREKLADTEARMVAVLEDLQLTELACSIKGLSPVGAAAILAETGDLRRFTSSRALVEHAGLAPRQRMSGTFAGRAHLSGVGRPHLRTAAWRAVWGAVKSNPVYADRYRHLTTRETNTAHADPGPDRPCRRDPAPAPRGDHHRPGLGSRHRHPRRPTQADDARGGGCLTRRIARPQAGSGRAFRGIESPRGISSLITGRPGPSSTQPDHTLPSTSSVTAMQGPTTSQGPQPNS